MGMAASQARFLGLTARKTNVEYEGQQVNQQRTTLSNQSANYYNQLLGMSVPVPPSVSDYTKTVYTFKDGVLSNSITAMTAQKDGTYMISYTSSWTNDFSVVSAASSNYTRKNIGSENDPQFQYYVGAKKLRELGSLDNIITDENGKYVSDEDGYVDQYLVTLSEDQLNNLISEEETYVSLLNEKYGPPENGWLVRYNYNSSSKTWTPYFVKKDSLLDQEQGGKTTYNKTGTTLSTIQTYTIGSSTENEEQKQVPARLEQDSSGRIISVTLHPGDDDEITYAVATNTITDQAKYDDAMNQYEYDKYQYDQSIQEINAKIEIIQSEDKNLELRLKQLDTEQKAIQTEMEAVQKVVEKNTESTFKTFG